jgi:peptidyl-prolyl cis-trans isomerase B (cyclophilin B)
MKADRLRTIALVAVVLTAFRVPSGAGSQAPGGSPVVVVETAKGTFSFETYPDEAPATVSHVIALVRAGFYDDQRIHRVQPGFVVQFGDPRSRDLSKRDLWGRGAEASSGHPVGVAEFTTKHLHTVGAVGLAHLGDPLKADSQIYITLADQPDLDGRYVVFGGVIDGSDVPAALRVGDVITRMYVKP